MTKRSKKWTLGAYSRGAGQFRYLGKFDTPTAACEAAGKKAWVYDGKLKNYVLYDPIKHAGINRVDCGKTPAEAYNFYHAAFRLTCPKLLLAWQSNKQNETAINNGENIVLSAGERIQITVNQDVEWEMHGLNWGEFGQGSRKAVVVSYKPDDMVVLKATNECEETHTLTFVFQAVAYDDANLSYDDAVAYNRERIRQIIKNIWGEYFDKKISLEQITPEVADFVQKVADEIIYQSQGMLMVDIVYNNWLTGIPKWSQTLFAHGTTMTADRFNSEKRYVFETYSNWFKVWNKEHAHLAVIRAAALKHRSELEILLLNQSIQN